jgi:microcystin-dependent protein
MMSLPYVGQIAIFAFSFAPRDWAFCQGQLMAISQHSTLFSILGTTYGGNGVSTFALPQLQGIPVGAGQAPLGSDYSLGDSGGEAAVALTPQQLPAHGHAFNAVLDKATSATPAGNQPAWSWAAQAQNDTALDFYSEPPDPTTALASNAIGTSGSGRPHNNLQPYLTLNFSIALQGVRPQPDGPPPPARTPFAGEISICAFGNPPAGWALCEGQLLQIARNQMLFSLLGTTYGGDGRTTFALPDLRGRVPLNLGENFTIGQRGGEEAHRLSEAEMPAHSHALMANATSQHLGPQPAPVTVLGMSLGKSLPFNTPFSANLYSTAAANAQLAGASLGGAGGGEPHPNMMPSLALSFCISLTGEYPSRG